MSNNLEFKTLIAALDGLYPNSVLISRLGVPSDMHRASLVQAANPIAMLSEELFGTIEISLFAPSTITVDVEGIPSEENVGYPRVGYAAPVWKPGVGGGGNPYAQVEKAFDPRNWERPKEMFKLPLSVMPKPVVSVEEFGNAEIEVLPIPTQEVFAGKIGAQSRVGRPEVELGVSPDEEALLLMFLEIAA
jgi:hypothetical protein